ncbi:MAG: sulfite exporter TauE/SafE family protein, partial [Verrucomicrobiales bacterium]|nr:sulfite exporter TauE/SafE family protein [Verrucomicrobiales bacterium]
ALTATIQNTRAGLVDWKLVAVTMVSSSVLAYFGAGWLKSMSNDSLSKIFGVVLIVFGVRMLLQK